MTANTKAILATVAAILCFATVMNYPGFFFVLLFLGIAGAAIFATYRVFLEFFNKG
jgi:hypothetical protein